MADDTSTADASPAPAPAGAPPVRGSRGRASDPRLADPRRGRREPQPLGRQRRAAVDRRRVRRIADVAGPRRRRLLARPRGIGPVARRARRPIRPQDAAPPGCRALDSGLPVGRVRTEHRGADRRAHRRWHLRRHGLPDDPRADHGALGPGPGRTHSIALWSALGGAIAALGPLVRGSCSSSSCGVGLPGHAAARGRRAVHGLAVRPGPRERDVRPGRQPRRDPVRAHGRDAHPGDQLRAGPEHGRRS